MLGSQSQGKSMLGSWGDKCWGLGEINVGVLGEINVGVLGR